MRRPLLTALFLLASWGAQAQQQRQTAQSAPDPFQLSGESSLPCANTTGGCAIPSRDVSAKTLSANGQTLNTGVQNCILIAAGQSNMANTAPTNFTPVNGSSLDFLNIYDGAIYKATDPLVGASYINNPPPAGGHPALRVADALVTAGKCSRVIIVPVGVAGTTVAQWATGNLANRLPAAVKRIIQRGITCGATNVTCVVLWGQGEQDEVNGTSQPVYTSTLNTVIANAAAAGFVGRWLVAKQTYVNGATSAAVQAAQTATSPSGVINNGAGVYLGANADALIVNVCNGSNACRQALDNIHWTDNGSIAYATDATNGWVAALHASGAPF